MHRLPSKVNRFYGEDSVMKKARNITKDEAFEIIELSTESVETLTKAFNLIAKACADETAQQTALAILNDDHVAPTFH